MTRKTDYKLSINKPFTKDMKMIVVKIYTKSKSKQITPHISTLKLLGKVFRNRN